MFRLLFHLSIVMIITTVLVYDQMYVDIPLPNEAIKKLPMKGRIIYLTFWCLIFQTVYHFIALLNDIAGSNAPEPKSPPIIRRIKDYLFPAVFSTNIYVSIAFWGVYLSVDKKMMEPLDIDKHYHPILNHIMHSTGTLFIFIELFTSHIDFPSRKVAFSILYTYLFAYVAWFFNIYYSTGNWVYPVCEHTSTAVVVLFVTVGLVLMGILCVVGEKLHSIVSGNSKGHLTNARFKKTKRN